MISGLRIARDVPGSGVWGDGARLRQILLNLVNNAIKFTDRGSVSLGACVLRRSYTSVWIRFDISRYAVSGINHLHERLFQPFTQLDTSSSQRHGDAGLGLAISRRLAVAHGRSSWASNPNGQGLLVSPQSCPSWSCVEGQEAVLPPRRVLLASCQVEWRHGLAHVLETWGLIVEEMDELHRHQSIPYDLVIGDSAALAQSPGGATPTLTIGAADSSELFRRPVRQDRLLYEVRRLLLAPPRPATPDEDAPRSCGVWPVPMDRQRAAEAEDNNLNYQVANAMLERLGCQVVRASDGQAALTAHRSGSFDVILMDCHMPEMDGYTATRAIRAGRKRVACIPIDAMTASTALDDARLRQEAGMDDLLAKPIHLAELRDVLTRWSPHTATS